MLSNHLSLQEAMKKTKFYFSHLHKIDRSDINLIEKLEIENKKLILELSNLSNSFFIKKLIEELCACTKDFSEIKNLIKTNENHFFPIREYLKVKYYLKDLKNGNVNLEKFIEKTVAETKIEPAFEEVEMFECNNENTNELTAIESSGQGTEQCVYFM